MMIKFPVESRWSSEVKFIAEIDCNEDAPKSVKLALSVLWAIKTGANLRDADLSGADLRGANLSDANLFNMSGNRRHIKTISVDTYTINFTSSHIQIGCERHTISAWKEFDDRRITDMEGARALKFWRKWKDYIFQTIEMSPAEPTRNEEV